MAEFQSENVNLQMADKNTTNLVAYLSQLRKVEFEEFKMNEKEDR